MKKYFVTGIDTDAGKTVVAAILTEALKADYWKPVQSGSDEGTDTQTVQLLLTNKLSVFHPESYCYKTPVSPHAAAEIENDIIEIDKIMVPETNNHLIIEGAGGLMVPLNEKDLLIDLMEQLNIPIVLVANIYLGSINHTLLSIAALKNRKIPIAGIIFNGNANPSTENIIQKIGNVPILGRIEKEAVIDKATIAKYAAVFRQKITL